MVDCFGKLESGAENAFNCVGAVRVLLKAVLLRLRYRPNE